MQLQSRNDQKKKKKNDAEKLNSIESDDFENVVKNITCAKNAIDTKDVSNALTCCAKDVNDIENDDFENEKTDKTFAVNKTVFDVQSMKIKNVKIENDNAVASCCEMSDRRFMIENEDKISM